MSKKRRVLITGAEGFVGSHFLEYLVAEGYSQVFAVSRKPSEWIATQLPENHIFSADLTDAESVSQLVKDTQPDWVIHLASLAFVGQSFEQAERVLHDNLQIQYVMLEAMRQFCPAGRILSVGSANAYGHLPEEFNANSIQESFPFYPNNPYAVSKISQEFLALSYYRAYGLDVVQVRPFNQIGPRQSADFAIPAFAQQVVQVERMKQPTLKVGNLSAVRDFTDVRDAVRAYELLMYKARSGDVYNIGSGKGVALQQVVDVLCELANQPVDVERDPSRFRPVDVPVFVADNSKLRALGWSPKITLRETLKDVLEYERQKL